MINKEYEDETIKFKDRFKYGFTKELKIVTSILYPLVFTFTFVYFYTTGPSLMESLLDVFYILIASSVISYLQICDNGQDVYDIEREEKYIIPYIDNLTVTERKVTSMQINQENGFTKVTYIEGNKEKSISGKFDIVYSDKVEESILSFKELNADFNDKFKAGLYHKKLTLKMT